MKNHGHNMDLEGTLIDHVCGTSFDDLPKEVVERTKLFVVDSLGVTFPGSRAPGCREVADLAKTWQSAAGATVLIHGHRIPPPMAAMVNSTMMHALDFDDTLDESALHTFVTVLPAALAASGHAEGVSGKTLITALILGVDVVCRISLGIKRPLSWIRTATCGSFGAAAAAGKVLGLSPEKMGHALGVVYAQTSGNAQGLVEGSLVKRMQPGFAAQAGVQSALLAGAGITGSRRFLEGGYGFYRLYERGDYDPDPVVEGLGEHYTIMDLSLKPYPCCRMTHATIDAGLGLRERVKGSINQIKGIEVSASSMVAEMVGKPFVIGADPQVDAQFSIPYTLAAALLRGDVFLEDFEPEWIMDRDVKALASLTRVVSDPGLPEKDILHSTVTITMKDGAVMRTSVEAPLGNPANPLDMDQCLEKFSKCLGFSKIHFPGPKAEKLLSAIRRLEEVSDVGIITDAMKA